MARTSRMALEYSARLRRWTAGRPGLGWAAAARSSESARDLVNAAATGAAGRGMPAGGISPVENLRRTRSIRGAFAAGFSRSGAERSTPAVGFFWLWQIAQY